MAFPIPGTFLHIKPTREGSDPLLRRAFSIFDYDEKEEAVEILYKVFGRGSYILSHVRTGETLDTLGPLGRGFDIPEPDRKLIMIGGGVGIPPVYLLAKCCLRASFPAEQITFLCGFAAKTDLVLAERVDQLHIQTEFSTDDGSYGYHGYVSELLKKTLDEGVDGPMTNIYACGPEGMLRAVKEVAREYQARCYLSLESIMPCGVGTCLGCVVQKTGEERYLRVCREGPVFDASEVEL
jgi:dihydroorotate dehydrogenase electron transfer subunit